jgi:putative tricarboxylic transport membrane protein
MENAFRQSLIISQGSFLDFVTHPISAFFLAVAALLIFAPLVLELLGHRQRPLAEAAGAEA